MKKYLIAGLMLASMNAFSQSYLILSNGVTLTTDNAGFLYDFGIFKLPYKVTSNGGQFLVENGKISTIDTKGFLYEKSIKVKELKGKGLNYLINENNHLLTVDDKGFVYEYEEDDSIFKKAIAFGGNFFTVKPEKRKPDVDLYTISGNGNYFKMKVDGLNPSDIETFGGSFFQTKSGALYTISKAGFVFAKPEVKTGKVVKAGGNYFIDSNNFLYTISEEGLLVLPVLPANIVVANLKKFGSNYMIDADGKIFTVDKNGEMFERTVEHDLRNAKIISL